MLDVLPEFPGGREAFSNYLRRNIRYPVDAVLAKIEGQVIVQFVVAKDGKIQKVKVLRGVCSSLDEEAVRVAKAMPKWKPGMIDNKPVSVSFTMPVTFRLK